MTKVRKRIVPIRRHRRTTGTIPPPPARSPRIQARARPLRPPQLRRICTARVRRSSSGASSGTRTGWR